MDSEVIVIGAGVLGVSLAYHLSQAGVSTIVLEREPYAAAHASGKNAGMLRQLYRHPQLTEWARRSLTGWPAEIRERCFTKTGSLIIGRQKPGHHDELFVESRLKLRTADGEKDSSAVATPGDGLLDPSCYVTALQGACDRQFSQFLFKNEVQQVCQTGIGWSVTTEQGGKFSCRWLVNAAGAWVNEVLREKEARLRINCAPFARHLFVVNGWPREYMPRSDCGYYWDEELNWYMRLWDPESRLVSICDMHAAVPETFVPHAGLEIEVAEKLLHALPDIAHNLGVGRSWHCFRTYTRDQLPVWGEVQGAPGLFWLAAFGGFGMSTSFAATEDAALYIRGEKVDVPKEFLPERLMG